MARLFPTPLLYGHMQLGASSHPCSGVCCRGEGSRGHSKRQRGQKCFIWVGMFSALAISGVAGNVKHP